MSAALLRTAHTSTRHVIDLDGDPLVSGGWKVEEHAKGGAFRWDASKVSLYLDKGQRNGNWIEGHKLRKQLDGKLVLNANVLDYLLENQQLIPNKWKRKSIFFWGTLYSDFDGDLFVHYLYWRGDRWDEHVLWLGYDFSGRDPAAVRVS